MSTAAVTGRSPASSIRRAATVLVLAAALVAGHPTAPAEAAARPGKPKILKVFVKGTGTLKAKWSGAKGATRYQVLVATNKKMTKGRKVLRTKKRSRTVTGLRQGTTYYVKVRAYKGKRLGAWGPRKARRTLYATPGTPRITARGTGYASAVASWTPATYATRYRVVVTRGAGMAVVQRTPWQSSRSRSVGSLGRLPAGGFYYLRVEADNAGKASRYSAPTKLLLVPYAPSATRVVGTGAGTITAGWARATNAERYELQARTASGAVARTVSTNRLGEGTAALNGLPPRVSYSLWVRSRSAGFASGWVRVGTAAAADVAYRLRVGTYNIACANPGARCSTIHRWSRRKAAVARMIDRYGYDVVGTQETSTDPVGADVSQGVDLDRQLDDRYTFGAHSNGRWIYYNRDTVEEVGESEQGVFPIGFSTGTRKTQYAVWQVFRHKSSGKKFAVVNSHLDSYVGYSYDLNRRDQTNTLLAQTARIPAMRGMPILHVGDFNSHELRSYDGPRAAFLAAGYLDADDYAASRGRWWFNSANGWRNPNPRTGSHVDHVYVPRRVGVRASAVDLDTDTNGRWRSTIPSDHNPVRVDLDMPAS